MVKAYNVHCAKPEKCELFSETGKVNIVSMSWTSYTFIFYNYIV